ncbi:MAG: M20 family metallopeptidase [Myxococcota bacterium]|nr:M20 family metallopeptidase [Myxococcota bacterium]
MSHVHTPLIAEAKTLLPRAIDLRRRIHRRPELGLHLPETRESVLAALEGLDLEIQLSSDTSGVVATLHGAKPGPTLLLRGDMDALPMPEDTDLEFRSEIDGAMHACGHDAHTAMLAGAADLLTRHRADLAGQVRFMFQPGEEGHFGARIMLEEGLLDGVDSAFAIHIFPLLRSGQISTKPGAFFASADEFEITVRGQGGHASMPDSARDPIPAACEIVQALQSFVTRRTPAFDPVVITVASVHAGTTTNVIPETATLAGTVRAVSEASRKLALEGVDRIARGVAVAHELDVDVRVDSGYPVTINHDGFTEFALETARELLGPGGAIEQPAPSMGAEDWSYVLQRVPGCMVILGVRPKDGPGAPCHSNRMVLNEEGMAEGIALHAAIALRYLDGSERRFR